VEETTQIMRIKKSVQNYRGNFKICWYRKVIK